MNSLLLRSFFVLLLASVLAPSLASATTKTEQVEQYLGTQRYKRERPVGTVKFVFQRAVLKRQGDGKKTYEQLLVSEPGFSNRNNAGRLVSIQLVRNGETIVVEPESVRTAHKKDKEPATRAKEKEEVARVRAKDERKPAGASRVKEEEARSRRVNTAPPSSTAAEQFAPAPKAATRIKPDRALAVPKSAPVSVAPAEPQKAASAELTPVAYTAPSAASAANMLASDPVRPRQNIPPRPGAEDKGLSLPDSVTVVRNIEEAKEQITTWKGRLWQTIKPAWEFVMWIFSSLIVILICFAGICRYVAKTAASESLISAYGRIIVGRWIVSAHQNAAAMLLVITWIIAIVLLLDVFMWLVYLNLPIWTLLIIWFPALWLAEKITSWIVPNIPIAGGHH